MTTIKSKHTSVILGVLTLVAIATVAPHAFAQQNGIPLGQSYGSNSVISTIDLVRHLLP